MAVVTHRRINSCLCAAGICNIYEFLAYEYPKRVDKTTHKLFLADKRDASIIGLNATPGSLCEEAMSIFASCYGAETGVCALKFMPFGGLYLTGGVTGKATLRYPSSPNPQPDPKPKPHSFRL